PLPLHDALPIFPPAVEAEPPPTNMSASVMSHVASRICPTSIVEKPPERGMTPANSADSTRVPPSCEPSVAGLVHSKAPIVTVPSTTSTRLVTIVRRVCSDQRRQRLRPRHVAASASSTGKPSEPRNTPTAIGRSTHQSARNGTRPSGVGTKPALLNEETA